MMNYRLLSILSLIILASTHLAGQWVVKHVDREGPHIYDLKMHPLGHGLAAGSSGFVLRTEDVGETWFPITSGISGNIDQVVFVTADTIVIASHNWEKNGTIHRSTDGGFSWEQVYSYPDFFLSLHFFNDSVGLASGINVILRTSDGGGSWSPVYDIPGMTTFKTGVIWMDIAGDSVAYAGVQAWESGLNNLSRFLLKSMDSGNTWQKLVDFEDKVSNCDLFFHSEWMGFMELGGSLLRTLDGGVSWEQTDNLLRVVDMAIPSDSVVYSVGWEEVIQEAPSSFAICGSLDGGKVWQCDHQVGPILDAIYFLNDTVGFVAGRHSLILKTEKGGGEIIGDFPWELYNTISQPKANTGFFRIHPNPASTSTRLELDASLVHDRNIRLRLFHPSGKAVYEGVLPAYAYIHDISVDLLASGIYYILLEDHTGRLLGVEKLLITP